MTDAPAALTAADLESALAGLPGWRARDGALLAAYAAPTAVAALELISAIGDAAEVANHHPDLDWRYDHVFVLTTTHDAGSHITQLDVDLAAQISSLAEAAGATAEPANARPGA